MRKQFFTIAPLSRVLVDQTGKSATRESELDATVRHSYESLEKLTDWIDAHSSFKRHRHYPGCHRNGVGQE